MDLPEPRLARLPDGRTLAYSDVGDPDGFPIVYCHGWMGSRLDAIPVADDAHRVGVRLITPDRPGYGSSPRLDDRSLIAWAADVHALVSGLGIRRYSVLGRAGGGPSAIACAFALSPHVARVGVVSAVGPLPEAELDDTLAPLPESIVRRAQDQPFRTWAAVHLMALRARLMGDSTAQRFVVSALSDTDRQLLEGRPELAAALVASSREAFRQGGAGPLVDLELMTQPWGFDLGHISSPILVWHGTEDDEIDIAHAQAYADLLLNARLTVLDGQGHLIFFSHAGELFEALKEGADITPA